MFKKWIHKPITNRSILRIVFGVVSAMAFFIAGFWAWSNDIPRRMANRIRVFFKHNNDVDVG